MDQEITGRTVPFFTVIIPTYNRAHSIVEAVESVLQQTFDDLELIVVDDGSTDGTRDILLPIANSDKRFRYVYQTNAERSAARNHGIRLAKGTFICFLDSDDIYLSDHLSELHNTISEHGFSEALYVGKSLTDRNGTLSRNEPFIPETEDPLEVIIKAPFAPCVVAAHSSILAKYKFDEGLRVGEDQELWSRICSEYPVIWSDHFTVVVRDFGDRTVDSFNVQSFRSNIELKKRLFRADVDERIRPEWKRFVLSAAYFKLAKVYLNRKETGKFYLNIIRSILISPKHYWKDKLRTIVTTLPGSRFIIRS